MRDFLGGIRKFILWEYPRGSWQYDVMVGLILAFIFLTPREWFRDQPRMASPSEIMMLPAEQGANVFWIEPAMLDRIPEEQRLAEAARMIRLRTGKTQTLLRLEPVLNSEGGLQGYMVFSRP